MSNLPTYVRSRYFLFGVAAVPLVAAAAYASSLIIPMIVAAVVPDVVRALTGA